MAAPEEELARRVEQLEARLKTLEKERNDLVDEPEPPAAELIVRPDGDRPASALAPAGSDPEDTFSEPSRSKAQWGVAGMMLALAGFALLYRGLLGAGLEQTALLFVGLPAFLGFFLSLAPNPKSFTGMALKVATLALLMSSILLQEGFICVMMAAPLVYGVTLMIGLALDLTRTKDTKAPAFALLAVITASSVEGTTPEFTFDTRESVSAHGWMAVPPDEVAAAIARTPAFDEPLPLYLQMGFPRPVSASGTGLAVGDRRTIHFAGGEGKPGDMVFEVTEVAPGRAVFTLVSDGSHIAHWLTWRQSEVRWHEQQGGTAVEWTVSYDRELHPAWYFGPWQRYGMGLAAQTLVDQVATP